MKDDIKLTRDRIQELLTELTIEQKVKLCSGKNFWFLEDFPEMGVPGIMVADGPHGLRKQSGDMDNLGIADSVPATCFPTAVTLASSWDRDLVYEVGKAIGEECRKEKVSVVLGPGANIKRSPLCGRNFEYYSEDPFLTGEMSSAFIRGVQSQGVGTSLKHFAVNNQEYHRMVSDSVVDERTLREIYLAGFETAVKKAKPWTVMCGYNKVNGTYCSDNKRLLTHILRDEWGFDGIVMSDWGGTNDRVAGISAGMDLEMPSSRGSFDNAVLEALDNGALSMKELDRAVERLLTLIMKPHDVLEDGFDCDFDAHHRLARRAAAESAVLLKNEDNILPLDKNAKIAIIGDMAKIPRIQGHGSSLINPTRIDSPIDEISRLSVEQGEISFALGYLPTTDETDPVLLADALVVAEKADVVVIFSGLPPVFESEGYDRDHMAIPANHVELIEKTAEVNRNLVVVLSNGSPVELPWIDSAKGVIEAYLGGQAAGGAIADVLFGNVNPGGKLAESFPLKAQDSASYNYFPGEPRQVQYREGLYVGYRYYDTIGKDVRFPFGYGLSYTSFEYSDLRISHTEINDHDTITVTVTVTNTGDRAGHETVQCYVHDPESSVYRPEQELKDFTRVFLRPGESREATLSLDRRSFAFYDVYSGDWQVETGYFEIRLGTSSRDIQFRKKIYVNSGYSLERSEIDEYNNPKVDNFTISDRAFLLLLGHPVPKIDSDRPFHINSTIGEIRKTFLGNIIYKLIRREAFKMWSGEIDETTSRIIEHGVLESPLRSMVLLTGGQFSFGLVKGIIAILNGRILRGLLLLLGFIKKPK